MQVTKYSNKVHYYELKTHASNKVYIEYTCIEVHATVFLAIKSRYHLKMSFHNEILCSSFSSQQKQCTSEGDISCF